MDYRNVGVIAALVLLVAPCAAQSQQNYPTKPIRLIAPWSTGTVVDILARLVGQKMSEHYGRPVVVDNRPGAGGTVGAAIVAVATPDGHTVMMQAAAHSIHPTLYPKLTYDTLRDLAGVSQVASGTVVLVIAPAQGIRSVKELIALAKAKPGQINYASGGTGSGSHINGEQFKLAADINVVHIPYKAVTDGLVDVATSRAHYYFAPLAPALPFIRDKRLMPLAVSTAVRSPVLPDVPTVAEAAFPGFEFDLWYGMFVPAKTPRTIVAQLSGEVARILNLPDIRDKMVSQGVVPKASTPEQFDKFVRAEVEKLGNVIRTAGVKVD